MHDPHLRADIAEADDTGHLAAPARPVSTMRPAGSTHDTVPQAPDLEFRVLAEHAPIGITRADASNHIVFANQRWREMTGYDGSLPLSLVDLVDLVHIEDRDRLGRAYTIAVLDRGEMEAEARLVMADGSIRTVVMRGAPIFTADRHYDGFVGSLIDVTELRTIERLHEHDEQRYRDLIAKSAVGQAVYSLDGKMVEVNKAWADLLGYEVDKVIGSSAADHVHPDDREVLVARIDALLSGALPYFETERRLLRHDGSSVWVSGTITVERHADDTPRHFHSLVVDIDERKRVELALRDGELQHLAVVESMHDGLIVHDAHDVLAANPSAARIMGIDPDRILDVDHLLEVEVVDTDGNPIPFEQRPSVLALFTGTPSFGVLQGVKALDGKLRWCLTNAVPLFHQGETTRPYAVALTFADITERKNIEDALRTSEERFRTLADALPVGVYRANPDGDLLYVNPRWFEISDAGPDELDQVKNLDRVHPDDVHAFRQAMSRALAKQEPFHARYRIVTKAGEVRWVTSRGAAVITPDGDVEGYVGSIEDITPLITAQDETHRLAGIVEATSDLVGIADQRTDRFIYLNRAAREKFGLVGVDISDMRDTSLFTPEAAEHFRTAIRPVLERGENWSGELTMADVDGNVFHMWQTMSAELDDSGTAIRVSSVGRDVTEQRRRQDDLTFRATHDDLTGLPNRTLLLEHLDLALADACARTTHIAILFVDLDRFKQVNDTMGHTAGDVLLEEAARRIVAVLRPSDVVARLGGDEFVILCHDVADQSHAVACAHRISSALERHPFVLDGVEVAVTASIGIALSSGVGLGSESTHAEAILRDADAAMYRAKDLGRARLEVFDEHMRERSAQRLSLTDQLTTGIQTGAIEVHYQPCVDLSTGRITSVEALARWRHPERGILGPDEFIRLAEETGLIVGLGLMVLSKACIQARLWELEIGPGMPRVNVNLSARQLTATNLPDLVRGVLGETGLTPNRLCLEITESVLMDDAEAVLETLAQLKAIGVALAIDDFGTGYSSLSYLRRFPVDILKIDHSFVDGLGPDQEDSAIVEAIIALARTLDLEAIAEGVETEDQLRLLRKLGCGTAQGFYFARPAPADSIAPLLTTGFVL